MAIEKITGADLAGKGVIGLPDIPALSTAEMQRKFEETVREVAIPKINEIIGNTYTKEEVEGYVGEKIIEIGTGDMAKLVYDKNNDGIVDSADQARNATNAVNSENSLKWNGYQIAVVDALPAVPDNNTIYFVRG